MPIAEDFLHAVRVGAAGVLNGSGGIRFGYYIELLPYGSGFVVLHRLVGYIERNGTGNSVETIVTTSWRCLG